MSKLLPKVVKLVARQATLDRLTAGLVMGTINLPQASYAELIADERVPDEVILPILESGLLSFPLWQLKRRPPLILPVQFKR